MGQPVALQGDTIVAVDIHIILIPAPPAPPIPTPLPHPFNGIIDTGCATNVLVGGRPVALVGSGATNTPAHIPQGGPFSIPPTNRATIMTGSATVFCGGKPVARMGDTAITCDDIAPTAPKGTVTGTGVTVLIG
jgi:uncharacterized Zn-binding protein involved in type VI secretion